MPPTGFEPTISAGERPQTYVLDRAATGNGWLEETEPPPQKKKNSGKLFWMRKNKTFVPSGRDAHDPNVKDGPQHDS